MVFGKSSLAKIPWEKVAAAAFALAALAAPGLLKPFVDTFAFGTSYGKLYAFAGYFLLLAFIRLPFKVGAKHVALSLLALFAFGLAGEIYFESASGAQHGYKAYAFDLQGYTSTHINHIHAGKTALCPLVPSTDYDCARPMLPYLPQFYPLAGMLLSLAALAACVSFYREIPGRGKAAYILLSFASLKAALDGGIFNYENIAFFMLLPFLFHKRIFSSLPKWAQKRAPFLSENPLAFTLIGIALWAPFELAAYQFFDPVSLAIPFLAFFFPIALFAQNPRLFFPLLAITLLAPSLLITDSRVIAERWQPDACKGAGANPLYSVEVSGAVYTGCIADASFTCGRVASDGREFIYAGQAVKKPELLISRGLSSCESGVFSIEEAKSSVRLVSRG
jgi:hypothetical protein